jgi:hypothetical protein
MSSFEPAKNYESVTEAEDDIHRRLELFSEDRWWISEPMLKVVIPTWTQALTAFSAQTTVPEEEAAILEQIEQVYLQSDDALQRRAELIGSGTMATLDKGHVLFIVLFRELQREFSEKANMNPHKLRVLLDGRYSVK